MGVLYNPKIVTSGLIAYWDAGNPISYPGSGTVWYDLSGRGNHGNLQATPSYSSGAFTFTAASSQYVSTTISYTNPTPNTVGVWFKTSTSNSKKIIGFETNQTGISTSGWDRQMYIGSDNKLYASVSILYAISLNTVTDNIWHNAVMSYGDGFLRLYLDGVLQQSVSCTVNQSYTGYWRLASYKSSGLSNASDGYFTGSIAGSSIYSRVLSDDEIKQNFNALRGRFGV